MISQRTIEQIKIISVPHISNRGLGVGVGDEPFRTSCLVSPKGKEPSLSFPSWGGKTELLLSTRSVWELG